MNYIEIHKKWQKYWVDNGTNKFDPKSTKPNYYCLQMFPYPSGANLHLGHYFNYAVCDTHSRFKRMTGYNVFQPFGYDAFGLPAENHAIKTKTNPRDNKFKNMDIMTRQINELGYMTDWDYTLTTCFPEYYKWTQWLFLQLFDAGLAYQKESPVNWCSKCNTVLANEQVLGGNCERCENVIVRKNMKQWFLKITDYAEELLNGIDKLDWPEKTKTMQKNWIGKSVGAKFKFDDIEIFTTRPDTIYGVTYVAIAPEHPLALSLITAENKKQCEQYIHESSKKSDIERLGSDAEKTGVFTGSYVNNPVTGDKVPVWIADYVLATYGTGAVMAVPQHDERDHAFATKYNLPIIDKPLTDINHGEKSITYRLRDWGIGRQRYWGCPIPIIHCDKCGPVAAEIPVILPEMTNFTPKGTAPLAAIDEFVNTTCPKCGIPAKREVDTMDTFVCSSFYFLRFPDPNNDNQPFAKDVMQVDKYIGGAEHACMHLLYARFITMFLNDRGLLNFREPFKSLVHQGMIMGTDGQKMSKSKGNTREPDIYTNQYGSDILRLFMLFGFNYIEGGPWNDDTIKSVIRFTDRILSVILRERSEPKDLADADLQHITHTTIKSVRHDLDNFSFNTAVARCMELLNAINKSTGDTTEAVKTLVLLTAPMFPHLAEEFWQMLGEQPSIFDQPYPIENPKYLTRDEIEIAVQINSKIVGRITIPADAPQSDVEKLCKTLTDGKQIKKTIYIKNNLINFIV